MQIGRPRISGYMEVCVTPRDRGTVRPVAAAGQHRLSREKQARRSRGGEGGGGVEVSGIAQACADTSLPREVLSAAK